MNNSQQGFRTRFAQSRFLFSKSNREEDEVLPSPDIISREELVFYPQAAQIYEKLAPKFPGVYINLAAIAGEDGLIEEAFDC